MFLYADEVEDRNDLRQEIISQAWRSFASFRSEAKFSTWLYRVAMNVSITFLKQQKKRQNIPSNSQVATSTQSDDSDLLERILRILNPVEKSIVLLLIEGYRQPEIAEILGLTEINTRTKVHRIRKKLQKHGVDQLT